MNDLKKIEKIFNECYEFDNLMEETKKYIEKVLVESDTNFLAENEELKGYPFNQLRVEYNRTYLLINDQYTPYPSFRLNFYLYEPHSESPTFIYDVDYNCDGEFMDEYFLNYL